MPDIREIGLKYTLDYDELIAGIEKSGAMFSAFDTKVTELARRNPIAGLAEQQAKFNTALGQQIQIYQRVEASQESFRKELTRLQAEYKSLTSQRNEFIAAGRYQELQQALGATKDRIKEIKLALGEASEGVEKVTKSSGGVAGAFAKVRDLAIGAFAVDKVLEFEQSIVNITGKFEKFEAVLTNALGSRSAAKDSLNLIADFAASTPFQVDEVTESFIKFVNRGLTPTKEQLTNLGDLAASQGKSIDQLTEAVLDGQSMEFERLKEFGIKASKSGDQVTLSFKGVTQTVKATSTEVTNAILGFGKLSGVAGGMASVSQILEGQVSNLGDSFDRLMVALGNSGVSGAFKSAVAAGGAFLGLLTDLIRTSPADELRKQQAELNGLVGAIALANDNETVRLNLITQLNQKYPEFLGKLDAESVSTDLLAKRLEIVNQLYEKKIRIALGEEKIKKANDDFTASIRQQSEALTLLAKESGKSINELEKLSLAQQIALAKQIARNKQTSEFRPSYFGQQAQGATDFIGVVLEGASEKQKKAQAELNKLLGENSKRQADLTETTVKGYQAQIKQIQEKIRLHQIDKKIGDEEVKRLQGEINKAKGILPKPTLTPTTTKNGPSLAKDLDDEKAVLLAGQQEYIKEYQKLEEEFGKSRLEALKKDSVEYINEKAKYDQKALKQDRDAFERRLQIANSTKTEVVNGKRQAIPNTSVTLENTLPEIAKVFSNQSKQIEEKRALDEKALLVRQEYELLELAKKSNENELKLFDKFWEEKLLREDKNSAKYLKLIEKRNRDRNTLAVDLILKQDKDQQEIELAFTDTNQFEKNARENDPTLNGNDITMLREKAKLAIRKDYGEKTIKLLKDLGFAENALLITQTQAAVDTIERQQKELSSKTVQSRDIYELLGITNGMDDAQLKAFTEGMQKIGDAIRSTTQLIIEQSEQKIQALDEQIQAKEEQVRQEEERDKEGYANNLKLRRAELNDLKKQKAEEEATKRKAQQVQAALDLATMLSSNAVSIANMYQAATEAAKQNSKLGPIVGVVAAVAGVATILATLFAARAKIKSFSQMREGGRLNGLSHEQGGIKGTGAFSDIEVEGREYVINKRSSDKYDKTLEALNQNDPNRAIAALVREGRVGLPQMVIHHIQQPGFGVAKMPDLSELTGHFVEMNGRLKAIEKHTKPGKTYIPVEGGYLEVEGNHKTLIKHDKR